MHKENHRGPWPEKKKNTKIRITFEQVELAVEFYRVIPRVNCGISMQNNLIESKSKGPRKPQKFIQLPSN